MGRKGSRPWSYSVSGHTRDGDRTGSGPRCGRGASSVYPGVSRVRPCVLRGRILGGHVEIRKHLIRARGVWGIPDWGGRKGSVKTGENRWYEVGTTGRRGPRSSSARLRLKTEPTRGNRSCEKAGLQTH